MKQSTETHKHSLQNLVDHLLLLFVVLTAVSGQILDGVVEHQQQSGHSIWLSTHISLVLVFTTLALIHFKHHWGWFRTLPRKLKARKKDSLFLLLALITLLVSGVFVTISKTHVSGFTHAVSGYLCLIVGIYHFCVRHIRR